METKTKLVDSKIKNIALVAEGAAKQPFAVIKKPLFSPNDMANLVNSANDLKILKAQELPQGWTDKPWNGAASRFTNDEWRHSCILDRGDEFNTFKERYALPVREPDGQVNLNAVHAAAGGRGIDRVKGVSQKNIDEAKSKLRGLYETIGVKRENFPPSIKKEATMPKYTVSKEDLTEAGEHALEHDAETEPRNKLGEFEKLKSACKNLTKEDKDKLLADLMAEEAEPKKADEKYHQTTTDRLHEAEPKKAMAKKDICPLFSSDGDVIGYVDISDVAQMPEKADEKYHQTTTDRLHEAEPKKADEKVNEPLDLQKRLLEKFDALEKRLGGEIANSPVQKFDRANGISKLSDSELAEMRHRARGGYGDITKKAQDDLEKYRKQVYLDIFGGSENG